jgi:hypothetical protein
MVYSQISGIRGILLGYAKHFSISYELCENHIILRSLEEVTEMSRPSRHACVDVRMLIQTPTR